jgi:hypothetical protein
MTPTQHKPYLLLALLALHMMPPALAQDSVPSSEQLTGKIDYQYVGHLRQKDDAGRVLVWEATIEGDVTGNMKWWFVIPSPVSPVKHEGGLTTFYLARWELWVDGELLLAGESAGKTVYPNGADGIWDGHGRVTEGAGKYSALVGRAVYETGPVFLGQEPPKTYAGTGMFRIY